MKKFEAQNILIPGLRNSDAGHWQTDWERNYPKEFGRVNQSDWERPNKDAWVNRIELELEDCNYENLVLIGHSVGCATIVHWQNEFAHHIKGALLVAPSDVDHPNFPSYITGFAPMPVRKLPVPSIVVASSDDHVVTIERAKHFATCWGSEFVIIQNAGHIETKSGFGKWEYGLELVQKLRNL